jgi:hypothetical protein
LANFRLFFRNVGENEVSHEIDSHGTRDGDATPSPGGGAAGVPLRTLLRQAILRTAAAFDPRTPRVLRKSCAASLENKAVETTGSLNRPVVKSKS